jgi:hypothetical protein
MDRLRCGSLAAWASAWLAGSAAFDDVLAAAASAPLVPAMASLGSLVPAGSMGAQRVDPERSAPLGEILIEWRRAKASVRVALAVPGDVRGVPGPADFKTAAIDAGQAVFGAGIGIVPLIVDHRPSSAPPTLVWQRYDVQTAAPDFISVTDAQHDLTEAIRDCASALVAAQLAGSAALSPALSDARRAGEHVDLPPGFPPRAVALIAQAERMAAVLAVAGIGAHELGGAVGAAAERARTLAPLVVAVRRARLAGYNAIAA